MRRSVNVFKKRVIARQRYVKEKAGSLGVLTRVQRSLLVEELLGGQNGHCFWCARILIDSVMGSDRADYPSLDHHLPFALGGQHEKANLRVVCLSCQGAKGKMHPDDFAKIAAKGLL